MRTREKTRGVHALSSSYRVHASTADTGSWDIGYHAEKVVCVRPVKMRQIANRTVHVPLKLGKSFLTIASHCSIASSPVDACRQQVADRELEVCLPF
jgi:hypothetical protein